jgi:hypothetical protein
MEIPGKTKKCPICSEEVKANAIVCWHCGTDIKKEAKAGSGRFVKVRLKSKDKIYYGDIYVPGYTNRISDVVNDAREFLSLVNTYQETRGPDLEIGYITINKSAVEWVRILERDPKDVEIAQHTRSLFEE